MNVKKHRNDSLLRTCASTTAHFRLSDKTFILSDTIYTIKP